MIKKIFITFIVMVISINVFAPLALGATKTPTKVDCPPSYVGGTKCFEVTNPEIANKTVKRSVHQRQSVVRKPGPSAMPKSTPGLNPAYLAFDLIMDQMEKDPTMSHAVGVFWNDVDYVDQIAGRIANKLTSTTAAALDAAYQQALEDGSNWINASQPLIDELFGAAINEVVKDIPEANKMTTSVVNEQQPVVSRFLAWKAKNSRYKSWKIIEWGYVFTNKASPKSGYATVLMQLGNTYEANMFIEYNDFSGWVGNTAGIDTNYEYVRSAFLSWNSKPDSSFTIQDTKVTVMDKVNTDFGSTLQPPGQMWMPSGYSMYVGTPEEQTNYPGKVTITDDTVPDDEGEEYYEETVPNPNPNGTPFIKRYVKTKTPGGGVAIVEVITIDKTGREVLPDGSVGKNPVTDPVGTVKPSPVVPPPLPPKDTTTKEPDPDNPTKEAEEEGNRWKALVTNKFPFSLPWDIYNVISVLTVDPERPNLDIDIKQPILGITVPIKMKHDFEWMEDFIPFIRTFILIGFSLFLILKTRTLLGGGQ